MKTLAALLVELDRPLQIEEIEIPALKPGQVLVEIAFSGACHTQVLEARGRRGADPFLPHCLGHEGSGTVVDAAPGGRFKPGDNVILSWLKGAGANVPGSVYRWAGRDVNAGAVTTFQRHAVVSENRLSPLFEGVSPQHAVMLGCALPTGMGAVFNVARPTAGQALAVFGVGGIGQSAVAAAALSGCFPIIAVDPLPAKRAMALESGASHAIDPKASDPVAEIRRIVPGGVNFAIEATGFPAVMVQALESVRQQGGRAVVIGNAPKGQTMALDPRLLNDGKSLLGCWGGDSIPERDFPRLARLIAAGRINVDRMLSSPYPLSGINDALDDLEQGRVGRPLIDMVSSRMPHRIGIDFDNTIVCYDDVFHPIAREQGLIPADLPASKGAVRDHLRAIGREDDWTELQGYVYGKRMDLAPPFAGALEFLSRCVRSGIDVIIISHKTRQPYRGPAFDLHRAARDWLDAQGVFDPARIGLPQDRAVFELTKQGKLDRIRAERCTVFIDDLPEFLSEPDFPHGVRRILFDPSSRHKALPGLEAAASWQQIAADLLDVVGTRT